MQEDEIKLSPGFKRLSKIAEEAMAIEREDAESAGSIGFIQRAWTVCSLPYKEIKNPIKDYTRTNGDWFLRMVSSLDYGMPFGQIPRLVHIYATSEVVKSKSRSIYLGNSLSDFMHRLSLNIVSGGRLGTITRLINQLQRMHYTTTYLQHRRDEKKIIDLAFRMSNMLELWNPKDPSQPHLWGAEIELTESYYHGIMEAPVPIDMRMVKALKGSPLELDIYFWLTHRLFTLKKPYVIPYELLQMQFGANYKRKVDFKRKFLKALKKVKYGWPDLNVSDDKHGLKISPSKLLIEPNRRIF